MLENELLLTILFWSVIACTIVFGVLLLMLFLAVYYFRTVLDYLFWVDGAGLNSKFERFKTKYPDLNEVQLIEKMVASEAFKAGMVGFFTGLGGAFTLPVMLLIDLFSTMKIQSRLTDFILSQNRPDDEAEETSRLKTYAVLLGSRQISSLSGQLLLQLLIRYGPKLFLEAIPILGGIVGFTMDYFFTRSVGNLALQKYQTRERKALKQLEATTTPHPHKNPPDASA